LKHWNPSQCPDFNRPYVHSIQPAMTSEEADFFRIKAWNSQEDADGYHPFIVIVSRNKGLKTGSRRSPAASGGQGKKTRGQENHWLGVVRFLVGEHGPLFAGRNNLNYGLLLLKVVA